MSVWKSHLVGFQLWQKRIRGTQGLHTGSIRLDITYGNNSSKAQTHLTGSETSRKMVGG